MSFDYAALRRPLNATRYAQRPGILIFSSWVEKRHRSAGSKADQPLLYETPAERQFLVDIGLGKEWPVCRMTRSRPTILSGTRSFA